MFGIFKKQRSVNLRQLIITYRAHELAYLAVFVWAYAGILIKHLSDTGHNGKYLTTIVVLTIIIAVMINSTIKLVGRDIPRKG